jgi:hypothetical protein
MKVVLLLGGLAVLALPALYLSRPTIVQAEDPPQVGAQDPSKTAADENPFNGQEAEPAALNPFGPPDAAAASPPDEPPSESPEDKAPAETPRAKPAAASESPFSAPARAASKAQSRVAEPSVEFLPEPSQGEKLIAAALDRKATFQFAETPLADVVVFVEDLLEHKVPIELDIRALEDAGVGADTPVTLRVKDVKLRTALKLLLDEYDLAYLIRDDVMVIMTIDKAETELVTRTYPVGDLLEVFPASAPKAQSAGSGMFQIEDKPAAFKQSTFQPTWVKTPGDPTEAPAAKAESGGAGAAAGLAKTGTQKAKDARKGNPDPYDVLIDVITTTVKPQTWDEVGGPGSISAVPVAQSLVISQTRELHDEILELLRALRAAKRAGADDDN